MDLLLILLIILLPGLAQIYISLTYKKYSDIEVSTKVDGFDTARKILDNNDLNNLDIVKVRGDLTDHYDSSRKVVRLSEGVFNKNSIAAMAVAAHECGHAIQDNKGYFYMKVRSFIFPVVKLATSLSYVVIFLGFLFQLLNLVYIGIGFVGAGLFFQIITLPVEFNASKRALNQIEDLALCSDEELIGARKMLRAAALTYVAGVLASVLQLLRLLLAANDRK